MAKHGAGGVGGTVAPVAGGGVICLKGPVERRRRCRLVATNCCLYKRESADKRLANLHSLLL